MHDKLSAAEARLRGVRTRDENACVVNDHGDGPLSWEVDESVSWQSWRVRETKKLRKPGMKLVNHPHWFSTELDIDG